MTDDELHDAIKADAGAKALADAGNDAGAAAAISAALPPVTVSTYINELGILAVLGAVEGDAALSAIDAAAGGNSLMARAQRLLRTDRGIDIASPVTQAELAALEQTGMWTSAQVAAVRAHAEVQPVIAADQVSRAWARYRPDGKVA